MSKPHTNVQVTVGGAVDYTTDMNDVISGDAQIIPHLAPKAK